MYQLEVLGVTMVSFVQILHAEKDAKLEERNNGEQV
jgi:hypothetical protein